MARRRPSDGRVDSHKALERALRLRFPSGEEQQRRGMRRPLYLPGFMGVEAVLSLASHLGAKDLDPRKANRLLSNYALLRTDAFGAEEHLMQMARRSLLKMASAMTWERCLDSYLSDVFDELRYFDVEQGKLAVREEPYGAVDRRPLYLAWILSYEPRAGGASWAQPGASYSYYVHHEASADQGPAGHVREVAIPKLELPAPEDANAAAPKPPREQIRITLGELIATAREVGRATGKDHYAKVLERVVDEGLLKRVAGKDAKSTDELVIGQVVSLVGLVGAGKSVLANTLMVALARRGYRVASLLNSVSDVMEVVGFLRAAGVSASPLVSKGERVEKLGELFKRGDSMLLDDVSARYLETPCLIDGLSAQEGEACSYGDAPCSGLRNSKGALHSCPFWQVCPSQAMGREALTSQVVVTTPAGFTMMSVNAARKPFFEVALQSFDLVIFDEADRVQVALDNSVSPDMSFQKLIRDAATPTARAMMRLPDDKMADLNVELFYDLRQACEPVAKSLLASVRTQEVASWEMVKKEAFTSLTLLDNLAGEDDPSGLPPTDGSVLPAAVVDDVRELLEIQNQANDKLRHAVRISCQGIDDEGYRYALDDYLESRGCAEMDPALKQRLSFLLKVIRFDSYLRELASSSDYLSFRDDATAELYNFLRFTHAKQQLYLPSSLIGNVFGMKLEGKDLRLYRQFGFGRAFMTSLPWLVTTEAGEPAGPHALLLSGSSWEPGCLQYHVNKPVDYLLEAAPWKAKKLEESQVIDLGIERNVSGSPRPQRRENLDVVLSQLVSTLRRELDVPDAGKALVIVNSYEEAQGARGTLERKFAGTELVCALTNKTPDDKERFVQRSELGGFAGHPARVLVAPAMAIERGYNIVDAVGHAAFSTLVFAVRPMACPGDLGLRYRMLNGLIEGRVGTYPSDPAEFAMRVRADAWGQWKSLERAERIPMSLWRPMGKEVLVKDLVAGLLVTIVQLFGRLARLEDQQRPAPHVYFADAAFRGGDKDDAPRFRTLEELARYMEWLMEESDQPQVARALYGPFYEAFKKGIEHGCRQ